MNDTVNPSKEQVRQWMHARQLKHLPPPEIEQIRRELGWNLVWPERHQKGRANVA